MKGKTKIILTNVETGEQEIHEDINLVTGAIDKIINIALCLNQTLTNQCLPIATKLLGGLMLFDEELTEDVDNIHFPTNQAHLVGYADQSTNSSDTHRGSYNSAESGKTETGYVSVWDFGTSQANGTIKSIARTSAYGGANPLRYYTTRLENWVTNGAPDTDLSWRPIRYDGEYVYMLKGNTTTHKMRLARVKVPLLGMGVAEAPNMGRTYEVIAEWDTSTFTYTYASGTQTGTRTVYADEPKMYEDGQDGYIYCMVNSVSTSYNPDYTYDVNWFTIKYSDESYEKSETHKAATGTIYYASNATNGAYYPERIYGHVCKGIFYRLTQDRKSITIIPLDNPASFRTVNVFPSGSSDYIYQFHMSCPHEGGVYYTAYHLLTSGSEWRNGILYPDGEYLTLPLGSDSWGIDAYRYTWSICDDLMSLLWFNDNEGENHGITGRTRIWLDWEANYLGTINNLSTPITKTAAQTMKIIYTLTDVDEEPAEE